MVEDRSPRFRSAGAALRFYFRAKEVLSVKASNRLYLEGRIPATGDSPRQNLMFDYLTVAACLKDLNELQRWLLRELYRPIRFGEPASSVTQACETGRQLFPRVRWTIQGVGRLHRHTVRTLEDRLADKRLIPPPHPTADLAQKPPASPRPHQGGIHELSRFEKESKRSSVDLESRAPQHANRSPARNAPRRRREVVFGGSRSRGRAMPNS